MHDLRLLVQCNLTLNRLLKLKYFLALYYSSLLKTIYE